MKTLQHKLRKNGFNYTQVLRGKRSCIYEQEVSKTTTFYEVFLIKTRPERTIMGKTIPSKEIYPNDEAFGSWAWAYHTLEEARQRFNILEQEI